MLTLSISWAAHGQRCTRFPGGYRVIHSRCPFAFRTVAKRTAAES